MTELQNNSSAVKNLMVIFHHLPQIHGTNLSNKALNHMDLGTPPEPGGEIFGSLNKK
jgi:hypothetical protein